MPVTLTLTNRVGHTAKGLTDIREIIAESVERAGHKEIPDVGMMIDRAGRALYADLFFDSLTYAWIDRNGGWLKEHACHLGCELTIAAEPNEPFED